jgi:hypothetical protein
MRLVMATFSDIDDAGTWAPRIEGVVGYWCNGTDDPTQGKEAIDVAYSYPTFTFSTGENSRTGILYVLCKS